MGTGREIGLGSPALLVAFSEGAAFAKDEQLLPELARQLAAFKG